MVIVIIVHLQMDDVILEFLPYLLIKDLSNRIAMAAGEVRVCVAPL